MPMVTRRGHVDKKPESFWARAWDACLTLLHIHDVDDRVGDANRESGFEDPDLYFGQLPLSFAACTGQVQICDELKDSFVNHFSRMELNKDNPTGIHPPLPSPPPPPSCMSCRQSEACNSYANHAYKHGLIHAYIDCDCSYAYFSCSVLLFDFSASQCTHTGMVHVVLW